MKIYKTGMVGFGFIGKVHAYGHMNIPLFYDQQEFKTRITHVCTSKTATAEKGAAQVGAEHAVTDYREITENPDIDIVDICTPNNLHFEALMSAIRHNKHIYCDKPLTATLDEAMQIKTNQKSADFPYEKMETLVETPSLFLLTHSGSATVLQKKDLILGTPEEFLDFFRAHAACPCAKLTEE